LTAIEKREANDQTEERQGTAKDEHKLFVPAFFKRQLPLP
jgi:hypothetical protein